MATVLVVLFLLVAIGWLLITALGTAGNIALKDLPRSDREDADREGEGSGDLPRVTVILPVRDEGERLERAVRGILSQSGVDLELIVVDDRSMQPAEPRLAEAIGAHPRLRVLRVDAVPEDWIAKCHACQVGAREATGSWLLFVDADACCAEDVVARALRQAMRDEADHLCLVPGLGECTLIGKAVLSLVTLGLLGIAAGVNRDFRFSYVGVGAFTLIRRDSYERIGGHRGVRLQIIEDFALGYLIRRAGMRSRIYSAIEDLEVRWAYSAPSFVAVLQKNMFAKLGYSVPRAVANVVLLLTAWAVPIVGAVLATPAGIIAAFAMASTAAPAAWMARRHGWSAWTGCLAPLSLPLLAWATVYSAMHVVRAGGVRWRGTFYPVSQLKAHSTEFGADGADLAR